MPATVISAGAIPAAGFSIKYTKDTQRDGQHRPFVLVRGRGITETIGVWRYRYGEGIPLAICTEDGMGQRQKGESCVPHLRAAYRL